MKCQRAASCSAWALAILTPSTNLWLPARDTGGALRGSRLNHPAAAARGPHRPRRPVLHAARLGIAPTWSASRGSADHHRQPGRAAHVAPDRRVRRHLVGRDVADSQHRRRSRPAHAARRCRLREGWPRPRLAGAHGRNPDRFDTGRAKGWTDMPPISGSRWRSRRACRSTSTSAFSTCTSGSSPMTFLASNASRRCWNNCEANDHCLVPTDVVAASGDRCRPANIQIA